MERKPKPNEPPEPNFIYKLFHNPIFISIVLVLLAISGLIIFWKWPKIKKWLEEPIRDDEW